MVKQKNRNSNNQRSKVIVRQVVNKRQKRKKNKVISPFDVNQLRFHSGSTSLIGAMQQLQAGSAHGMGTQMLGSTGNFYLDNLVDPFRGTCRIPDDYTRPTAVHQSFAHFDLTTDANGQATIFLNPVFGDGVSTVARNRWVSVYQPSNPGAPSFIDDPDIGIFATGSTPVVAGVRPVSAAMLLSFVGDTLNDGGQVSAAWLPGDIPGSRLNTLIGAAGRSTLALEPGAYSGTLRDGAYVFWKPDDREDYHLRTLAKTLTHEYPILAICIQSTQVNTVVARVACVTNFEFSTDTRVCESSSGLVEPDLVLHAKKILSMYPTSCSNDGHISLWDKIRTGCVEFFRMVGDSIRGIFAPSLESIGQNADGIRAISSVMTAMNPGAAAVKAAAAA